MRTTLLQSYKTRDVPAWIETCLNSAQSWANAEGWSYRFLDDDVFDFVPAAIRDKLSGRPAMMSDIARLIWARQVLSGGEGVERVIWLDADVFVFAPQRIQIGEALDFAVGRQVWIQPGTDKDLKVYRQVHNAILLFTAQTPVLDFLIHAALSMAERLDGPASPQMLGPKFLTALHNMIGFPVIESVGMASPLVLSDIASGGGAAWDRLTQESASQIRALNLCSSYRGQTVDGILCDDALFETSIKALGDLGIRVSEERREKGGL